ncbi:MAG: MATE family efflux transporter [Oscillospiraceae bacterium]|nr:MATE family efflux transporter [Oscillospiraceae bacterium]
MTEGSILRHILLFAVPLMFGNLFQMLYNTVDSVIVGNFVGKQALAAIGSTTMIVNMLVFFFNGFSAGAGVIISHRFGAKQTESLHTAVETSMAATFIMSIIMTVLGVANVRPMLRLMATPDDVFAEAASYLTIYIAGISGLLIYNMCSGILRAVGDSRRPLFFLVLTSVLNIALDLLFVIVFKLGIEGAAYATIISQAVSALLTLRLLSVSKEAYALSWKDLGIEMNTLKAIFSVGLPAGIQAVLTAFSNVFVQSYINVFGSGVMAGWSSYNKLDQFIMLPMQSVAMSATTFVSQNVGAKQYKRADAGTKISVLMILAVSVVIAALLYRFAEPAVRLFSPDPEVISYGALFIHTNAFFFLLNCINHTLTGALRGYGDSRGPMVIMLTGFVAVRQIYLFVLTRYISNTPKWVGFGYPVGWMATAVIILIYYTVKKRKLITSGIT